MKSALAIAMLAFNSPASAAEVDISVVMAELTSAVEASEPTLTSSLLGAIEICEDLLSQTKTVAAPEHGWVLRLNFENGSIYTKSGMFIMHVLSGEDFPEQCGVISIPFEDYDLIKLTFSKKYGTLTASDDAAYRDRPFPTATLSSTQYSYRLRSAENPESALAITVRHKE
jgi:hypothetical protein